MLIDYREEECYEQFADWLRYKLTRISGNQALGKFRLITDDESALYNPFVRIFETVHGLCYIHMEDSLIRYVQASQS